MIDTTETTKVETTPQVALKTIFTSYFIIGLTAFGFAILQKLKGLSKKNLVAPGLMERSDRRIWLD